MKKNYAPIALPELLGGYAAAAMSRDGGLTRHDSLAAALAARPLLLITQHGVYYMESVAHGRTRGQAARLLRSSLA